MFELLVVIKIIAIDQVKLNIQKPRHNYHDNILREIFNENLIE